MVTQSDVQGWAGGLAVQDHRNTHLVARHFTASGPNQLWIADITGLPTAAGFLCRAVVLDGWSRKVVGWSMATHLRAELVLDALEMAAGQRRPRMSCIIAARAANRRFWRSASEAARRGAGPRWHDVGREREVRIRVIVGGAGSKLQVSRRTELGSGNKREGRFTHRI